MNHAAVASRGTSHWTISSAVLGFASVSVILILPAIYNRFPLIFPDTAAYLSVGYGDRWTLDRSAFYGLLLKPILSATQPVTGLWLALAVQVGAIAAVLLLAIRHIAPSASMLHAVALVATTALLTSLPWHAAQLMPDALTGALILLTWVAASRDSEASGTPFLWLATAILGLVHYTHLPLIAVAASVTLIMSAFQRTPLREIFKRVTAVSITIAVVVAAHVVAYGSYFDRWSVAPMSSLFLFARVHEDGLTTSWFDRHCGKDAPQPLCDIQDSLPRDSQVLLWGGSDSPLTSRIHEQMGSAESWRWIDMLGEAARGSIKEQPMQFIAASTAATTNQFLSFRALDDECPRVCRVAMRDLVSFRPDLKAGLYSSRQLEGDFPKRMIRLMSGAVSILGLILMVPFLIVARRRRDAACQTLLCVVGACLVANAALAGALSDVHDRYQSRVIWLVPFVELLIACRWSWIPFNRANGGEFQD